MTATTLRKRALAALATATLTVTGTLAASLPAHSVSTPEGKTSVAPAPGKSQGSGEWGYVGDIDTMAGSTYTYGIAFDPTDQSLTVSDSGKVLSSSFGCSMAGSASPCQLGTPRIFDYTAIGSAAGVSEEVYTQYAGNGAYAGQVAATADGTNAGLGLKYENIADRTVFGFPTTEALVHGPRGITYTSDGIAWVVDSEATAPLNGPARAIKRFDQDLTPIDGAGWTGAWADRNKPGVHFYRAGAATTPAGTVLVNSEVSDRLQEYAADGTWIRSILLDLPSVTGGDPGYRNPYGVAVDPVDSSIYVPLINFRDDAYWVGKQSFIEKRDADGKLLSTFGQGHLGTRQVIFNVVVEPRTQDVFAWTQNGNIQQFTKDGVWVREFTPAEFPGLTTPRGLAFDQNGRMYITVAEGTNRTRVMILGKTPAPTTSASASCTVDRKQVTLNWANTSVATQAPYQESTVLDFVVETSPKGENTWTVVDHAPSAALTRTLDVDDASVLDYRISAWNEAGNGDFVVVDAPVCAQQTLGLTLTKEVQDASGDGIADLGETLTYTFTLTNTGNVAVNSLSLIDEFTTGGAAGLTAQECQSTELGAAGSETDSTTCTGTYVVIQADIDAGVISNSATASAVSTLDGEAVESLPATAQILTPAEKALAVMKTAGEPVDVNGNGLTDPSDTVVYTFSVTNIGDVTVEGLDISDPLLEGAGVSVECDASSIAPGADAVICTSGAYTLAGPGELVNTATAIGTAPDGSPVVSDPSTATVTVSQTPAPALAITKTARAETDVNGNGVTDPGDTVVYDFIVTNTGNVPVSEVAVDDDLLASSSVDVRCQAQTLEVGQRTTCESEPYALTTVGYVVNTATAIGTTPWGAVTSEPAQATVIVAAKPSLPESPAPTPSTTPNPKPQALPATGN